LGSMAYWLYLTSRAARALENYEEELPQVVARLISGAQTGSSLTAAAEHVARFGPLNCRDDWAYIAAQLRGGAEAELVFKVVSRKRQSQLLNSIFEMLLLQQQRGLGLSDVLPLIQMSLEERTRVVRKARARMAGPIRELWIVCAAPFVAVVVARLFSPEFAAIYGTWVGQGILFIGWGITAAAFVVAQRSFSEALRKETDQYGALRAQARPPLKAVTQSPGRLPAARARRGANCVSGGSAPSSLAGVTVRFPEDS